MPFLAVWPSSQVLIFRFPRHRHRHIAIAIAIAIAIQPTGNLPTSNKHHIGR